MQKIVRWNSFQKHLSGLVVFRSLFLKIGSVIACEAPPGVCDWKKKIVGLKTDNMIASGVLIDDGVIITNRHVVKDYQSGLVGAANRVITSSTNRKIGNLAWEKITALALMFASITTTVTALAAP